MSDTNNGGGKKPDLIAYNVTNSKDGKNSYFNRVGAAWQHQDGEGFEVDIESFPRDGRVTLRTRRDAQMQDYDQQAQTRDQGQQQAPAMEQGQEPTQQAPADPSRSR